MLKKKFSMKTTETFLVQFRDLFRLKVEDRNHLSEHLIFFETYLTRFQHRCVVKKESDEMNLSYLMRELVIADSFKIATLLFTLSSDLDDQMNIITLRNLIYEQITAKLSDVVARDKLKKKKNEENKVFSSTSFKNKKKKKTNSSFKNDDTKIECIYCKKHFLKFKWSDHT
jgi:hypothetical protein